MKKTSKIALSSLAICGAGCLAIYSCHAETDDSKTAEILLTINQWALTIGIDGTNPGVNFWTINPSFTDQDLTAKTFSDPFWIEDLKWSAKGYTTTINVSDLDWKEGSDAEGYSIPAANVKFTANWKESWDDSAAIYWVNNDSVAVNGTTCTFSSESDTCTYISREENTKAWVLWRYGTKPSIDLKVPANTPAGEYEGTITYTLIDKDTD